MLTRKIVRFSAVALIGFACMLATEARAQIAPALTAPLSCSAALGGGTLTVQAGFDGLLFPHDVPCPSPATGTCSEYTYRFTSTGGGTLSHSLLSVSADLDIYATNPSASIEGPTSCSGDSINNIGRNVCEQRQIRFNANASTVDAQVIVTRAASRVSTAGARKGNAEAFCLIQGPGVPGGAFTPFTNSASQKLAGGKLDVLITFGPDGKPNGGSCNPVQAPGITCFEGSPVGDLTVNGQVLRDFKVVTFGDGTSTCLKGNPTKCYCTAAPCP